MALRNIRGFTLLEIMTVMIIVSVLASVGIPMYSRYIKKSKAAEARTILRKIFDGQFAYYDEDFTDSAGKIISKRFLATEIEPNWPPGKEKRFGNFEADTWNALRISSDSPLLYSYFADAFPFPNPYPFRPPDYDVTSDPPNDIAAGFQVTAVGDIDGDGHFSLFQRSAGIEASGKKAKVDPSVYVLDELE